MEVVEATGRAKCHACHKQIEKGEGCLKEDSIGYAFNGYHFYCKEHGIIELENRISVLQRLQKQLRGKSALS